MSVPLDYAQRQALVKTSPEPPRVPHLPPAAPAPGQRRPTAPQPHTMTPTSTPLWPEIQRRARALVESGEAKDLSTALEAIRQQHPDVYEAHVAEQRQAHRSVVKADVPAPAQAPIHTSVVEFQKRVEALREQGLLHHIAVAKVEASPEGKRLRQRYYNDNPQLGCRS